jgi:hypothetical protein
VTQRQSLKKETINLIYHEIPLQYSVGIIDSSHADYTSNKSENWKVKDFRYAFIICLLLLNKRLIMGKTKP